MNWRDELAEECGYVICPLSCPSYVFCDEDCENCEYETCDCKDCIKQYFERKVENGN